MVRTPLPHWPRRLMVSGLLFAIAMLIGSISTRLPAPAWSGLPVPSARLSALVNTLTEPAALDTMRNPSAVYCEALGYAYSTVTHPDGAQSGLCHLPGGESCDAWAFLTGTCGPAYSACARAGLKTVTRSDGQNPFGVDYAVCVDAAGRVAASVVEMTALVERSLGSRSQAAPVTAPPSQAPVPSADTAAAVPGAASLVLPTTFDWRAYNGGNWLTPVKNQGICGSCWAFSAVGIAEAALNIAAGDPNLNPNLSEQVMVTDCCNAGNCAGGNKAAALQYIVTTGVPDEACLPYGDGGTEGCSYLETGDCDTGLCTYSTGSMCSDYHCSQQCSDWATRLYTINGSASLGNYPTKEVIKQALVDYGPLSVSMNMEGAFDASKVYRCTDNVNTGHAVIIVGYSDTGSYWIVRNSWGSTWGPASDGYFKVAYDNCAIQKYPYRIDSCTLPAAAPTLVSPASNATLVTSSPSFSWSSVTGATYYELEIATNTKFSPLLVGQSLAGTTYSALPLSNGTYYWRVRACSNCGCSDWPTAHTLTLEVPDWTSVVRLPLIARQQPLGISGIVNSDFEAGPTGWTEYSLNGWDIIMSSLPVTAHSGKWAAWLAGDYDEVAYVQQKVTVPPSTPYLAYWHWIASEDACGYDFGGVIINGTTVVDVYDLCETTATGGWAYHVVDLRAYAGQSVMLQLRAETDYSLTSHLFIDNVTFVKATVLAAPGDRLPPLVTPSKPQFGVIALERVRQADPGTGYLFRTP